MNKTRATVFAATIGTALAVTTGTAGADEPGPGLRLPDLLAPVTEGVGNTLGPVTETLESTLNNVGVGPVTEPVTGLVKNVNDGLKQNTVTLSPAPAPAPVNQPKTPAPAPAPVNQPKTPAPAPVPTEQVNDPVPGLDVEPVPVTVPAVDAVAVPEHAVKETGTPVSADRTVPRWTGAGWAVTGERRVSDLVTQVDAPADKQLPRTERAVISPGPVSDTVRAAVSFVDPGQDVTGPATAAAALILAVTVAAARTTNRLYRRN